jgi:hypothetical protein
LRGSKSFRGKQIWLLSLSGLLLLCVTYIAGATIQSRRDERNFSGKENRFSTLTETLKRSSQHQDERVAELSIQADELIHRLVALEASFEIARADDEMLTREDAFLNRYIAYGSVPNEINKNALVESVCALWKNGDKLHVQFESLPLGIAPADMTQGRVSADLQTLLVENFIPLEPIQHIRLSSVPAAATPPSTGAKAHQGAAMELSSEPVLGSVQKQISSIKILSSVKFADGARYNIPKAIAVATQIRRECIPF